VLVSLATGAVLHHLFHDARWLQEASAAASPGEPRLRGPVILRGPGGPVTLPMATPVIVNLWVQGSTDSVGAFDASRRAAGTSRAALDLPVVNVALGSANLAWAREHGLDERLVFDPDGRAVVHPLKAGGFTTVVLDPEGWVRLSDRPDNPGFTDRLQGAIRALRSGPPTRPR
jgi:hypothetical protein